MEIINFVGACHSKDGKWVLVTFARKDTDEKLRLLVPYVTKRGPVARDAEDGLTYVYFPMKKEEPKEEPKEEHEPKEDEEIPF